MKKYLHLLLILPIIWLFYNRAANWHFHELPNGIVIEHAHVYNKSGDPAESPFENHTHTDFEYFLLDIAFRAVLILLISVVFFLFFRSLLQIYTERKQLVYLIPIHAGLPPLRAPPSV